MACRDRNPNWKQRNGCGGPGCRNWTWNGLPGFCSKECHNRTTYNYTCACSSTVAAWNGQPGWCCGDHKTTFPNHLQQYPCEAPNCTGWTWNGQPGFCSTACVNRSAMPQQPAPWQMPVQPGAMPAQQPAQMPVHAPGPVNHAPAQVYAAPPPATPTPAPGIGMPNTPPMHLIPRGDQGQVLPQHAPMGGQAQGAAQMPVHTGRGPVPQRDANLIDNYQRQAQGANDGAPPPAASGAGEEEP